MKNTWVLASRVASPGPMAWMLRCHSQRSAAKAAAGHRQTHQARAGIGRQRRSSTSNAPSIRPPNSIRYMPAMVGGASA